MYHRNVKQIRSRPADSAADDRTRRPGQPLKVLSISDEASQAITEGLRIDATPPLLDAAANYMRTMISMCTKYWEDEAPRTFGYNIIGLVRDLAESYPYAFLPALARSLHDIGYCESKDGRLNEAADHLEEAFATWNRVLGDPQASATARITGVPFPHDSSVISNNERIGLTVAQRKDFLQNRLMSANGLAHVYRSAGRTADTTKAFRWIIDSYQDLVAIDPCYMRELAYAFSRLAVQLWKEGSQGDADLSIRQATEHILRFTDNYPDGLSQTDITWLRLLMTHLHLVGDHAHADSIESLLRRVRIRSTTTPSIADVHDHPCTLNGSPLQMLRSAAAG
jgi:tetratricopeptide (TPR) repeat protein